MKKKVWKTDLRDRQTDRQTDRVGMGLENCVQNCLNITNQGAATKQRFMIDKNYTVKLKL